MIQADVRYRLTLSELAEAHRAARRAAWPKRTLVADIFAAVLAIGFLVAGAASAVFFADLGISPLSTLGPYAFALVWVFAFSTPGRAWLVATVAFLAVKRESRDVTLEEFSGTTARFRTISASSDIAHRGFPIHVETKRLFVVATDAALPVCAIPKRTFTDTAVLEAFRARVMRTGGTAVVNALDAFAEPVDDGSVEYVPDVDEQLRAAWLLLVHTAPRVTQLLTLAAILTAPGYVLVNVDAASAAFTLAFLVTLLALMRWNARRRMKAQIRPVRFVVDERGLRAKSENGVLDVEWSQALGYVERDPRVLLVIIRPGFGMIMPTRALPAEWFGEVRRRLAPYRRA